MCVGLEAWGTSATAVESQSAQFKTGHAQQNAMALVDAMPAVL